MRGIVVLAHAQNLTNHRGNDMRGHIIYQGITILNMPASRSFMHAWPIHFSYASYTTAWIDMTNQPSSGPIQGHCDRYPLPHPDSQHAGTLAHPAPPVPTQQGQGYFVRTLCGTIGLALQPSGIYITIVSFIFVLILI